MDFREFWQNQRSTIISAVIAIVVIAGLFVLFNALPTTQTGEQNEEEQQQEQDKDEQRDEEKKGKGDEEKVDLPAQYTVKKGDNLWKISEAHYGTGYKWAAIASVNKIDNPDVVFVGAKLRIPMTTDYKVKSGDTLWDIAETFYKDGHQWTKILDANPGKIGTLPDGNQGLIAVGQNLVIPR
ncbi:MAG: LysM peptidoglycan-binding domain-containing protein [Candidatus Woykebacteria bacterium]